MRCPECNNEFEPSALDADAQAGWHRCPKCLVTFHEEEARAASLDHGPDALSVAAVAAGEAEFTLPRARPGTVIGQGAGPGWGWSATAFALVLVLVGETTWFYRKELVASPIVRPLLEALCENLSCRVPPRRSIPDIELLDTNASLHPEYENVLRIKTQLVNRAPFAQPWPLVELVLTDHTGAVIARRAFPPAHYLGGDPSKGELLPNIAQDLVLDVTNPVGGSAGYEIRLAQGK